MSIPDTWTAGPGGHSLSVGPYVCLDVAGNLDSSFEAGMDPVIASVQCLLGSPASSREHRFIVHVDGSQIQTGIVQTVIGLEDGGVELAVTARWYDGGGQEQGVGKHSPTLAKETLPHVVSHNTLLTVIDPHVHRD